MPIGAVSALNYGQVFYMLPVSLFGLSVAAAELISGDPDLEDIRKYFRALRTAQRDIDLRPDLYTHYFRKEFPSRFLDVMDTRRWGPGERLVFEPYTKEVFEESFKWIAEHAIFTEGKMGSGNYEESVISLAAE